MPINVFFAWQSDRDVSVCRYLIRDAARSAIKRLSADAKIKSAPSFNLDEATKGATGHPHIAALIRKKIATCEVFLADLTHVADYNTEDGRKKKAQNGNVLIELGMAIRARGFSRLILVMNEAYGGPEELPFDLKSHSFPITYSLATGADSAALKAARDAVATAIANKLKPMVTAIHAASAAKLEPTIAELQAARRGAEECRQSFEQQAEHGVFYPFVPDAPSVTMVLVPLTPPTQPIDLDLYGTNILEELRPFGVSEWSRMYFEDRVVTFTASRQNPDGTCASNSVSACYLNGMVQAASIVKVHQANADGVPSLNIAPFERSMIMRITEYVGLLRRLGVYGPLMYGMSLLRLGRIFLHASSVMSADGGRVNSGSPFRPDMVEFPASLDGSDNVETAAAMRPLLDRLWRAANYSRDLHFGRDGKWKSD